MVAVAPGGSGKSRMAAALSLRLPPDVDVCHWEPRRFLVDQIRQAYRDLGHGDVGEIADGETRRAGRILVCTAQSLATARVVPSPGTKRCVIHMDEGHRARASTWEAGKAHFVQLYDGNAVGSGDVRTLVWTASPYRLDGKSLAPLATTLHEIATPRQLARPDATPRGPAIVLPRVWTRLDDMPGIPEDAVDIWWERTGGAPTIAYAPTVAAAKQVAELFAVAGVPVACIFGETPSDERDEILARLGLGGRHPAGLAVVVNVDVLTEGFDSALSRVLLAGPYRHLWAGGGFPEPPFVPLGCVADFAPTESMCEYVQRVVRVCRTHVDKPCCVHLDFVGNVARHGFIDNHEGFSLFEDVAAWQRRREVEAGFQYRVVICGACGACQPPGGQVCRECGLARVQPPPAHLRLLATAEMAEKPTEERTRPRPLLPAEQVHWARRKMDEWTRLGQAATWLRLTYVYKGAYGVGLDEKVIELIREEYGAGPTRFEGRRGGARRGGDGKRVPKTKG